VEFLWFAVTIDNPNVKKYTKIATKVLAAEVVTKMEYLLNYLHSLNRDIDFSNNGNLEGYLVKRNPKLTKYGMSERPS
jgi:hypothetical protein